MAPKFGTSGLRGLVTELTTERVQAHVRAFLSVCPHGGRLFVGRDLRASSPAIAADVIRAAANAGVQCVDCGVLPTPALALASMSAEAAAVMVTGSHIPADRNGLKFYTTRGEITKADEEAILNALSGAGAVTSQPGTALTSHDASSVYAARYVSAYGPSSLTGLTVGVYQHSSVARDLMVQIMTDLGATVVPLARSERFMPVDTEAVDPKVKEQFASWCATYDLDALVSTDGDADRPMVTDATGQIVPGDVLGALTALSLGATVICTPISSNTMIDTMPVFRAVHKTRIGSPYVIAAMAEALKANQGAKVVGYEANGGFLLGFAAEGSTGPMAPLLTRDCLLPIIAPLHAAAARGQTLADLVAELPARFTATDRIAGIPADRSQAFIAVLRENVAQRTAFFATMGDQVDVDTTDGVRIRFASGDIVHLRPSGNAPEFRCYAEASDPVHAQELVAGFLAQLRDEMLEKRRDSTVATHHNHLSPTADRYSVRVLSRP